MAQVRLADLKGVARFPDCLGYVGLVLHHCSDQAATQVLSDALIPQFIALVKQDNETTYYLQDRLDKKLPLTTLNLGKIETALRSYT